MLSQANFLLLHVPAPDADLRSAEDSFLLLPRWERDLSCKGFLFVHIVGEDWETLLWAGSYAIADGCAEPIILTEIDALKPQRFRIRFGAFDRESNKFSDRLMEATYRPGSIAGDSEEIDHHTALFLCAPDGLMATVLESHTTDERRPQINGVLGKLGVHLWLEMGCGIDGSNRVGVPGNIRGFGPSIILHQSTDEKDRIASLTLCRQENGQNLPPFETAQCYHVKRNHVDQEILNRLTNHHEIASGYGETFNAKPWIFSDTTLSSESDADGGLKFRFHTGIGPRDLIFLLRPSWCTIDHINDEETVEQEAPVGDAKPVSDLVQQHLFKDAKFSGLKATVLQYSMRKFRTLTQYGTDNDKYFTERQMIHAFEEIRQCIGAEDAAVRLHSLLAVPLPDRFLASISNSGDERLNLLDRLGEKLSFDPAARSRQETLGSLRSLLLQGRVRTLLEKPFWQKKWTELVEAVTFSHASDLPTDIFSCRLDLPVFWRPPGPPPEGEPLQNTLLQDLSLDNRPANLPVKLAESCLWNVLLRDCASSDDAVAFMEAWGPQSTLVELAEMDLSRLGRELEVIFYADGTASKEVFRQLIETIAKRLDPGVSVDETSMVIAGEDSHQLQKRMSVLGAASKQARSVVETLRQQFDNGLQTRDLFVQHFDSTLAENPHQAVEAGLEKFKSKTWQMLLEKTLSKEFSTELVAVQVSLAVPAMRSIDSSFDAVAQHFGAFFAQGDEGGEQIALELHDQLMTGPSNMRSAFRKCRLALEEQGLAGFAALEGDFDDATKLVSALLHARRESSTSERKLLLDAWLEPSAMGSQDLLYLLSASCVLQVQLDFMERKLVEVLKDGTALDARTLDTVRDVVRQISWFSGDDPWPGSAFESLMQTLKVDGLKPDDVAPTQFH